MAKLNESYEAMIVFSMGQGEDGIKALIEKFKGLIEQNAELTDFEDWGKRKLAYEIDYQPAGYYVIYRFTSAPAFPAELDRVLKITDGVLRSLITTAIVKKDDAKEEK